MSVFSSFIECSTLQIRLDEAFRRPQFIPDRSTFMEYLLSPEGRQGLSYRLAPGKGKVRRVEVIYNQRALESELENNISNPNCEVGDPVAELSETYDLDTSQNISKSFTFESGDFERVCRENSDLVMDQIAKTINVVERGVATYLANTAVSTLVGNWAADAQNQDGTTVTNPLLTVATKLANGNIDPTLYTTIDMARRVTGYDAGIAFTDQTLWRYAELASTGCCVTDMGVDLRDQLYSKGTLFSWDRRVMSALAGASGTPNGLFVAPGSLAFVPWTKSGWKDGIPMITDTATYFSTVIFGPSGMPMDLIVTDNCGTVTYRVIATPFLKGMPTDMFQAGDVYDGVTGVNFININNPS